MSNAGWTRPVALALVSAALVGAFFLLREHWGHALGYAPYLLLLLCPLMHLLHHRHGGGGHGHPPEGRGTFDGG